MEMKPINPNDIKTLDVKDISLITLKNGDMLMIDETAEQKSNIENKIIQ